MVRKKNVILSLRISRKTRFILETLGFINKIGKVIIDKNKGSLNEFLNKLIERSFSSLSSEEWKRKLIQEKVEEMRSLEKQIVSIEDELIAEIEYKKRVKKEADKTTKSMEEMLENL